MKEEKESRLCEPWFREPTTLTPLPPTPQLLDVGASEKPWLKGQ
jgi:hypothetical protein